jgi:hypothetical protein
MSEQNAPKRLSLWQRIPGRRIFISAFIIVHLYIMTVWGLPASEFRTILCKPIQAYTSFMGLWHAWNMFSPEPLATNFHVQAEVHFQNGNVRYWDCPRMEDLVMWERFQKERHRKWQERVRQDISAVMWPDTARQIARMLDTPRNHPTRVILIRYWEDIPAPAVRPDVNKFEDYQPIPDFYPMNSKYHFFSYDVKPEDL